LLKSSNLFPWSDKKFGEFWLFFLKNWLGFEVYFYLNNLPFYININLLIESKWSRKPQSINSQPSRTSPKKPSISSIPNTQPISKLSNKKLMLLNQVKFISKDQLKNHTYIHSTMLTIQFIHQAWNGSKLWVKSLVQNKSLLIMSTSASPEDTLWLSGLDFYFWDLLEQLKIFLCSLNHQLKLGSFCFHTCTSTLKVRNISWCQCSQDSIQRSQLWNLWILKLIIKKMSKLDAEIWWHWPSHKSNIRLFITNTFQSETIHFLA